MNLIKNSYWIYKSTYKIIVQLVKFQSQLLQQNKALFVKQPESIKNQSARHFSKLMENESLIELMSEPIEDTVKLRLVGQGAKLKLQKNNDNNNIERLHSVAIGKLGHKDKQYRNPNQDNQFINMFIVNQYGQNYTDLSQVDQVPSRVQSDNIIDERDQNNDLNFIIEKIINDQSFEDQQGKPSTRKTYTLKLNDKKLYNTRWISRLQQMAKPHLETSEFSQNINSLCANFNSSQSQHSNRIKKVKTISLPQQLKQFQQSVITSCQTTSITLDLMYPPHLKTQAQYQKQSFIKYLEKEKIKKENTSQHSDFLQEFNHPPVEDQDIELIISYHSINSQINKFIEEPLDEQLYPSTEFNIRSYLTYSQILKIKANYHNFLDYVRSKALNDLFLIRSLNLDDLLSNSVDKISLLQKISALRRYFDVKKRQRDLKKKKSQRIKQIIIPSFLNSQKYELHGNKQLLQQLWDLYGSESETNVRSPKTEHNDSANIIFTSRLTNTQNDYYNKTQVLKFVQFVPQLSIHRDNYTKFVSHFSELKRVYFNGMSVGFKGFRISNFTTRSENNITFVFQEFHQLVSLQALLVDFQFQLNNIEQLQKEYEETPKRTIKKVRVKERFHSETKPWVEDMFQKQSNNSFIQPNKNMSFSVVENITMTKPPDPRLATNHEDSSVNTTSVNSSFFLNSVGYCQNLVRFQSQQGRRSKQIYFCKIDRKKPDYENLIRHLNSITEMSKTVIIDFEKMFELFTYKNKLTSLINVCCSFEAADLQLLPQPLEIVKVHEDYQTDLKTIKDQAKELLENEEKFACLYLPNSQKRINPINCFNIIKMNEEHQARFETYKRIRDKYGQINGDNEIYNQQFEEAINTVELIIPNEKAKNEFVCFPFHNKTFKINRYFEPGSGNLLQLQLKQTNERSQNFIPSEQTTFNQYKQRMIKQGVDFFYFCYPFGEKFKLNLCMNNLYSLTVRNQIKFRKEDHLRVMYWLGKINKTQNKFVFYQESRFDNRREEHLKIFAKEKMPEFEKLYDFGFVEDCLKEKIKQIQVYTGKHKSNPKTNNLHFKKSIHKFLLSQSSDHNSKAPKAEAYKICTNRTTWDFVLKKLKTICQEKQTQLRRIFISEKDDLQFQAVKKSLKVSIN